MKKKNVIALIIIVAGIGTSFFIYGGPLRNTDGHLFSFSRGSTNPSFQFEPAKNPYPNAIQPSGGEDFSVSSNLTDLLAGIYAQEIFKNVEPGSGRVLQENIDVSSLNLTAEELQRKISQGLQFPEFETGDLKISNDNSPEGQVAYMESVDALLRKSLGGFKKNLVIALDEFFQRNDSDSLDYLVQNIPKYLIGLLELEVPSSWQDYHLQTLNLWQKKLVTYRAILGKNDDPLKAYLAIQYLTEIAEEDLSLQAILIESYEELNS